MPTAELVLSRFPRHLDADQPGKVIGEVVGSLATPLDSQISQIGKLRRSHRSGELEQQVDLLRLGGLHGFDDGSMAPLLRRIAALADVDVVADPAPALDLLGLEETDARAPFPGETDDSPARARLAAAIGGAVAHDAWLAVARRVLIAAIADERHRSATIAGLLGAAADYLGFEVDEIHHDSEGFWHLARCRDRVLITRPSPPGPDGVAAALTSIAGQHLLALEENPPYLADLGPIPRRHADRFHVTRKGFDAVPCTVMVKGVDDRTLAPMIVNVDDGEGIATTVTVPAGATLRFERDGRVELDGSSVARRSFVFHGAVFAEPGAHVKDFVFADADDEATGDRIGTFAVTTPLDDAFDPSPSFPHGDGLLRPLRLDRAETRFAVFVGAGVFGGVDRGAGDVLAAPEPIAGFFDETVFQPDPAGTPSFEIGFEWDEREAYAVRVWLPFALQQLDREDEPTMKDVVRTLLDRHRAAGVHAYVEYADPRWILGTGLVRDLDSDDALGVVVAGTEAWTDDTSQPSPGPVGPTP